MQRLHYCIILGSRSRMKEFLGFYGCYYRIQNWDFFDKVIERPRVWQRNLVFLSSAEHKNLDGLRTRKPLNSQGPCIRKLSGPLAIFHPQKHYCLNFNPDLHLDGRVHVFLHAHKCTTQRERCSKVLSFPLGHCIHECMLLRKCDRPGNARFRGKLSLIMYT